MGAGQSAPREGPSAAAAAATAERKTCYYEVLDLDRQADDAEIRKAYKKKALALHPDRNYGDEENATRRFAEVQTAYEILSDPQERAWYDSHRDAILGGHDPNDDYDLDANAPRPPDHHTSADAVFALMSRFDSTVPMTDSPAGFFGSLNAFFAQLAEEEVAAAVAQGLEPVVYPSFGMAGDEHDAVARPFYAAWSSFATRKSFAWKDRHRLADAPDRRVRRLMERENRKLRDEGVRQFNDAVLSLVAFVRKRDPRYVPNAQSEAERQRVLRDSAAAQAARSRAANLAKLDGYVVPGWAQAQGNDGDKNHLEDEFSSSDEAASEVEEIECVVCNKFFRSEKQFEAHERSKKHTKAVQQLQWQMRKENADLNLSSKEGTDVGEGGGDSKAQEEVERESARGKKKRKKKAKKHQAQGPIHSEDDGTGSIEGTLGESDTGGRVHKDGSGEVKGQGDDPGQDEDNNRYDDDNDEDEHRSVVKERLLSSHKAARNHDASKLPQPKAATDEREPTPSIQDLSLEDSNSNAAGGSSSSKKVGKARLKREKKAARQASPASDPSSHICAVCNTPFSSRTKLFAHINKTKHAAPVMEGNSTKKKK